MIYGELFYIIVHKMWILFDILDKNISEELIFGKFLKFQPSVTKNDAAPWKIHKNQIFLQFCNQNNIPHHWRWANTMERSFRIYGEWLSIFVHKMCILFDIFDKKTWFRLFGTNMTTKWPYIDLYSLKNWIKHIFLRSIERACMIYRG